MGEDRTDRRVKRTRKTLQDALIALILEKGYEAITVQDVIDRADVGRSTFYAHFVDKEALLLSQFEHLQADFERHFDENAADDASADLLDFSGVMFQHAQRYRRVYQAVVGKQSGQLMQRHLEKTLTARVRKRIDRLWIGDQRQAIPPDILTHHLVSAFMSLMIWWLDHDLPHPPERMDHIYRQLIRGGIDGSTDSNSGR
jgi:AcrR family transcriptional regulator